MVRRPSRPRRPRKLTSQAEAPGAPSLPDQDVVPTADLAASGPIEIAGEDLAVFDTGSLRQAVSPPPAGGSGEAFDPGAAVNLGGGTHVDLRSAREGPQATPDAQGGGLAGAAPARRSPAAARPADLSARRAERKAERRKLVSRRAAAIAAIVLAGFALAYAVFFSPLFSLDAAKIEVRPPKQTTVESADVVAALAPRAGTSLFRLAPSELARTVEEKVARTGDVRVDRVLPHGLRVSFADRSPIACLVRGDSCLAIDEAGREVTATADELAGLIHISYASASEDSGRYALDILQIVERLPEGLAEVVGAEVAKAGQITLLLADGRIVRWGMPGQTEEKAGVLEVLMAEPAALYDVSVPRSPMAGPSPAASQGPPEADDDAGGDEPEAGGEAEANGTQE